MKNRILMLLENETYPGDPRVLREATALTQAGYRVAVICPAEDGQPRRELLDGVRVYRFGALREGDGLGGYLWEFGYSLVATFWLSWIVFFRQGFDVIHAHNPPDLFVFIAMFYRITGVRFLFDHHDLSPDMYMARLGGAGNRWVYRALVFFEQLSCRIADQVIATNESYKAIEQQRSGISPDKITVVRNGPNLEKFKLVPPDPALRARAGTLLGYVGVMGWQDGIDYLLRAARHLIDEFQQDDFLCVLIGDGAARNAMEALADELHLGGHVLFTGSLRGAELLRHLSSTDICLVPDPSNPYNDRSTMIKMMEYMALEKPVVSFDLVENRASAGDAALYAQANDEVDFARQIARLIDDPTLGRQLGAVGRERVVGQLGWHHQEPQLLEAYRKIGATPQPVIPAVDPRELEPTSRPIVSVK